MNAELAQITELKDVLGKIQNLMLEIDEDPEKLNLDDLTSEDPNAKRNKAVSDFLSK